MAVHYSDRYYRRLEQGATRSARETVPLILHLFPSKTVLDVGCGIGAWLMALADEGCDVFGIDTNRVPTETLLIPRESFGAYNLEEPLRLDRRYDLVMCLEVAEHLSPGRASSLVVDLCRLGDVVVFSSAIPGQGGTHHVNEQWPSYWIDLFRERSFEPLDCIRHRLWTNTGVEWWYAQNTFAFVRSTRLADFPKAVAESRALPADLVHPRAFVRLAIPSEMTPRMLKEVVRALPYFPGKIVQRFRKVK